MGSKDFTIRIGEDEIGHILDRKENLDHHGQLWEFMSRYQALGWDLALITAQGADLGLDLQQPQEAWWKQLADLGLEGVQVNLAVRTGRNSRLLVLEVNKGGGTLSLDLLGDWRAQCVAELGNCREQHYYYLPPESRAPSSHFLAHEVLIYGEGGLVLAPPSIEPEGREPWRWLTSPWENPPQAPKPAVWQFLREQTSPASAPTPEMPGWEEIYRTIAPYDGLFKVLMAPPVDMEKYYRDIIRAARMVGLADPQPLQGLLWHAPHGDARTNSDRWRYLLNLLANENPKTAGNPGVPGPWAGTGASPGGPGSEPPALAGPMASLEQILGVGELTRQLLGETETESSQPKFEKSVSGQFFQLLAVLGDKVIGESCRNEALQSGLGTQATELERLVAEMEQCAAPAAAGAGDPKATTHAGERGAAIPPWMAAMAPQPRQKTGKLQEVKAKVQDFLSKNPDLAEDRNKVQMVLFCLKNYVSINPDYAGLSFREKLEKAGQMSRTFMSQPPRPQ
ncbi:MAG: bifunctional DNA primase/polymerase [Deltaproteobacteria bacterium]|nr:bifunctional DNA primase/polymerase [Deltaproteobacteria bacterium]